MCISCIKLCFFEAGNIPATYKKSLFEILSNEFYHSADINNNDGENRCIHYGIESIKDKIPSGLIFKALVSLSNTPSKIINLILPVHNADFSILVNQIYTDSIICLKIYGLLFRKINKEQKIDKSNKIKDFLMKQLSSQNLFDNFLKNYQTIAYKWSALYNMILCLRQSSLSFEQYQFFLKNAINDQSNCCDLWKILAVQALTLNVLCKSDPSSNIDPVKHSFMNSKTNFKAIEDVLKTSNLSTNSNGIMMLSWSLFNYLNDSESYKMFLKMAINNHVFLEIQNLLNNSLVKKNQIIYEQITEIIYDLMSVTLTCFDLNAKKLPVEFFEIFKNILSTQPNADDFWEQYKLQTGVANILHIHSIDHYITISLLAALSEASLKSAINSLNFIVSTSSNQIFILEACQTIPSHIYCTFVTNTYNYVSNVLLMEEKYVIYDVLDELVKSSNDNCKTFEYLQNLGIARDMIIILSSLLIHSPKDGYWYANITNELGTFSVNFIEEHFAQTISAFLSYASHALITSCEYYQNTIASFNYKAKKEVKSLDTLLNFMATLELSIARCVKVFTQMILKYSNPDQVLNQIAHSYYLPFDSGIFKTLNTSIRPLEMNIDQNASIYERLLGCYEVRCHRFSITTSTLELIKELMNMDKCNGDLPKFHLAHDNFPLGLRVMEHLLTFKDLEPTIFMQCALNWFEIIKDADILAMSSENTLTLLRYVLETLKWGVCRYNFIPPADPACYDMIYDVLEFFGQVNTLCQTLITTAIEVFRKSLSALAAESEAKRQKAAKILEAFYHLGPASDCDPVKNAQPLVQNYNLLQILASIVCSFNNTTVFDDSTQPGHGGADLKGLETLTCSNVPLTLLSLTLLKEMTRARTTINATICRTHSHVSGGRELPSHAYKIPPVYSYFDASGLEFTLLRYSLISIIASPFGPGSDLGQAFEHNLPLNYYACALSVYELIEALIINGEDNFLINLLSPPAPLPSHLEPEKVKLLNFYDPFKARSDLRGSDIWVLLFKPLQISFPVALNPDDQTCPYPQLKSLQMACLSLLVAILKSTALISASLHRQTLTECPFIIQTTVPDILQKCVDKVLSFSTDRAFQSDDASLTLQAATHCLTALALCPRDLCASRHTIEDHFFDQLNRAVSQRSLPIICHDIDDNSVKRFKNFLKSALLLVRPWKKTGKAPLTNTQKNQMSIARALVSMAAEGNSFEKLATSATQCKLLAVVLDWGLTCCNTTLSHKDGPDCWREQITTLTRTLPLILGKLKESAIQAGDEKCYIKIFTLYAHLLKPGSKIVPDLSTPLLFHLVANKVVQVLERLLMANRDDSTSTLLVLTFLLVAKRLNYEFLSNADFLNIGEEADNFVGLWQKLVVFMGKSLANPTTTSSSGSPCDLVCSHICDTLALLNSRITDKKAAPRLIPSLHWLDQSSSALLERVRQVLTESEAYTITLEIPPFVAQTYASFLRYLTCVLLVSSAKCPVLQLSPILSFAAIHGDFLEITMMGQLLKPRTIDMAFYDYFLAANHLSPAPYLTTLASAFCASTRLAQKSRPLLTPATRSIDRAVHRVVEACVAYLSKPVLLEERLLMIERWCSAPGLKGRKTSHATLELRINYLKSSFYTVLLNHLTILRTNTFDLSNLIAAIYNPDDFEPYHHFLTVNFAGPQIAACEGPSDANFAPSYGTLIALVKICLKELEICRNVGYNCDSSQQQKTTPSSATLYKRRSSPFSEKRRSSSVLKQAPTSAVQASAPSTGSAKALQDFLKKRQASDQLNLHYCLEMALYILISQALTFVKDPQKCEKDKIRVKRDLAAELNALFDAYPWPSYYPQNIESIDGEDTLKYYDLMTNLLNYLQSC